MVKGVIFNLTEARVTERRDATITVKVLIQNIGDRMGLVRWTHISIKRKEEVLSLGNPKEYEWQAQPNTQTPKGFHFEISMLENLNGCIFLAKGVYSSHKGRMEEKIWSSPLSGSLNPLEAKTGRN